MSGALRYVAFGPYQMEVARGSRWERVSLYLTIDLCKDCETVWATEDGTHVPLVDIRDPGSVADQATEADQRSMLAHFKVGAQCREERAERMRARRSGGA